MAPHYAICDTDPPLPKATPAIPLAFSDADDHLGLLRKLLHPSVIAVVSVNELLLQTTRSLLAPTVGQRHTMHEFRFPLEGQSTLKAVDLVFADSIVRYQIKHPKSIRYQLIRRDSLAYIVNATNSYKSP